MPLTPQLDELLRALFRRGLSMNLNRLGIDDEVIQKILRHSDVAVTQKCYIKPEETETVEAKEKLSKSLTHLPQCSQLFSDPGPSKLVN